jgi:hypothetical protein
MNRNAVQKIVGYDRDSNPTMLYMRTGGRRTVPSVRDFILIYFKSAYFPIYNCLDELMMRAHTGIETKLLGRGSMAKNISPCFSCLLHACRQINLNAISNRRFHESK